MTQKAQIKLIQILVFVVIMHFLSFDLAFAMGKPQALNQKCEPSSLKLTLQSEATKMDLKTKKFSTQLIEDSLPQSLSSDQLSTGSPSIYAQNTGSNSGELKLSIYSKKSGKELESHSARLAAGAKQLFIKMSQLKSLTAGETLVLKFSNLKVTTECPQQVEYHAAD